MHFLTKPYGISVEGVEEMKLNDTFLRVFSKSLS